jgi:hypothetical protein
MRTSTIANSLLLVLVVTCIVSCKDDDEPALPPITVTGANTFGCLIDGEVYVPQGVDSAPLVDAGVDMIVVSGGQRGVNLQLVVRDTTMHFIFENQAYHFNQENITCVYDVFNNKVDCDYRDTPVSGYIKFSRIDFAKHIVAGVFEFSVYSAKCDKMINITDGRFDLRTDM